MQHWWIQKPKQNSLRFQPCWRNFLLSPEKLLLSIISDTSSNLLVPPIPPSSFKKSSYTIITDSLTSLRVVQNPFTTNPLAQRILLILAKIGATFLWLVAHYGVTLHDKVDLFAKQSTHKLKITTLLLPPPHDLKQYHKQYILSL